jgi:hypothetical protein
LGAADRMQDPASEPSDHTMLSYWVIGTLGKQALILMKLSVTKASDQAGSDIPEVAIRER